MRPIQFGHSQEGNKMKKVLSALTITALMASPVFADAQHKHGDDKTGSMSGMMHHEKMTSMNEHMQEMREAMEKIKEIINKINENLTMVEKIKKFNLINENFSIENGLLTPTMKVKRNKVIAKYKNVLENFYKN